MTIIKRQIMTWILSHLMRIFIKEHLKLKNFNLEKSKEKTISFQNLIKKNKKS